MRFLRITWNIFVITDEISLWQSSESALYHSSSIVNFNVIDDVKYLLFASTPFAKSPNKFFIGLRSGDLAEHFMRTNVLYCYSHEEMQCLAKILNFFQQKIQNIAKDVFLAHAGMFVVSFYPKRKQLSPHYCKQSTPRSRQSFHPIGSWRILLSFSLNHANSAFMRLVHPNSIFSGEKNYFYPLIGCPLLDEVQTLYFVPLQ